MQIIIRLFLAGLFFWVASSVSLCGQTGGMIVKDASINTLNNTWWVIGGFEPFMVKGQNNAAIAFCHLLITNNASLHIDSQTAICVNGQLENPGGIDNLVLRSDHKGTASLIHHNQGVHGTLQRFISPVADWYASNSSDWHMISSPVCSQTLSAIVPEQGNGTGLYDLYSWYEPDRMWVNYKQTGTFADLNDGLCFNTAQGYLVAYKEEQLFSFIGEINAISVAFNDLSYSTPEAYGGWHLLGNPFAAAIDWNNEHWYRNGVNYEVHVWDREKGNYLFNANGAGNFDGIIRANQGMFVKVTSPAKNASLTIPAAARMHTPYTATGNNKSLPGNTLELLVKSENSTHQDAVFLRIVDDADSTFDPRYDAHKLHGSAAAPEILVHKDLRRLSIKSLTIKGNNRSVSVLFKPGSATNYILTANGTEHVDASYDLLLTDLFTGNVTNLRQQPTYAFESCNTNDPERFLLSFVQTDTATCQEEPGTDAEILIHSHQQTIFVSLPGGQTGWVVVYGPAGQALRRVPLPYDGPHKINTGLPPGVYVVSVNAGNLHKNQKVMITIP